MAKFNVKAIAIFGVAQIAENNSAIKSTSDTAGTMTTSVASTAITGVGTSFLTELTPGAYVYNAAGDEVCRVKTVESDTAATAYANSLVALAGVAYATGLGPQNALAVLNLNYSTELTKEAFQYVGDELNRDEETVINDKYAQFDFEVFIPSLGTIAGGDPTIYEVPMVDWFQSAGMAIVLSTGSGGYAKITNSVASNVYMTVEVRRSSPDLAGVVEQKVFQTSNTRGFIDLDAVVGTRGKLKFNFMGNLDQVVQKTTIVADFQDQKVNHAGSIKSTNITLTELVLYTDANEPALTAVSNACFDKVNAPNWTGFSYDRYLTGCFDGWSKEATPSDVTLTVIEDAADATYNPDNHLEENHVLNVKWGSVTGSKAELYFHKLQLGGITNSTVATYAGQDLNFRNVGYTDLILS